MRSIDSASPWRSWLSSRCLPWLPARLDYERLVGMEGAGWLLGTSRARGDRAGQPQLPQETAKKDLGPLTLMLAGRSGPQREGKPFQSLPALSQCQAPHPTWGRPLFFPRGCASSQVTQGLGLLCQTRKPQ